MSKRNILNIIIILLFCHDLSAQVEKDTQSLIDIIHQLEQQFHCSFSYADENLENIFIAVPPDLKSLKEISKYLEENTILKFTFLENNRIVISPKNDRRSICGYFIDNESDEAIPGVTIQADSKATVSNEQGYFELKNISVHDKIFVKHIKYKSIQYNVNDFIESKCNNHFLVSNIEEIQEIIISNYLTKGIQKPQMVAIILIMIILVYFPGSLNPMFCKLF